MKKTFLTITAALAALMSLTACTSDETVEQNLGDPISFVTSLGAVTRAEMTGKIFVYAEDQDGKAFFTDQTDNWLTLNADGSIHTDSYISGVEPKYYMPSTGSISFYAINVSGYYVTTDLIQKNSIKYYRSSGFVMSSRDNCAAFYKANKQNVVIPLNFQHLLAHFDIKLKNSRPDLFKIEIQSAPSTISAVSSQYAQFSVLVRLGEIPIASGAGNYVYFNYNESSGKFDVTSDINPKNDFNKNSPINYRILSDDNNGKAFISTEPDDNLFETYSYLLPQAATAEAPYNFAGKNTTKDNFLALAAYNIIEETDSGYKDVINYYNASSGEKICEVTDLFFPLNYTFEAGKEYTIIIDLAKGGYIEDPEHDGEFVHLFETLPISFAPSLADWDGVEVEVKDMEK